MADVSEKTEAASAQEEVILEVNDLRTYFTTRWGTVKLLMVLVSNYARVIPAMDT